MRIIFVASPLRSKDDAEATLNVEFAKATCRAIALAGGVPFAPHLLFADFLDDAIESERALCLRLGKVFMARSDEVWTRVPPWRDGPSDGMIGEIGEAEKLAKPLYNVTSDAEFARQLNRLQEAI